jgi:N-acetylmuramoyl-L-alanine amidase
MAVVRAREEDVRLLARLLRAEAEGEGDLGMLMVGNVGINRILADCGDFKDVRSIQDMVYQRPGGFEATQKPYFYQKARNSEMELARKVIRGDRYHPAGRSLWFIRPSGACPATFFNQPNVGRYKEHCFFNPLPSYCPNWY